MPYPYNPPAGDNKPQFGPLPVGEYDVIIEHAVEKTSSSGREMMELTCVVQGPERAGAKLWDYIVYNEHADRKFRDILRSCGLPDLMQDITPELFEGATGRVKVKHELYQGERKAKIHYWIEVETESDPDMPPPPSADEEPAFDDDSSILF
jgi:hypothetical protein